MVHLKVDHFAAIVRHEEDRYLLQDPTLRQNVWVTTDALEDEASGFFLVPAGTLAHGWRSVTAPEAETIWGKGIVSGNDPRPHGPCDPHTPGSNACDNPQATARGSPFHGFT